MRAHEPIEVEEEEEEELDQIMTELDEGQDQHVEEEAEEKEELPVEIARYQVLVDAMEQILAGQDVDLAAFEVLGDREREALAHLTTIVRGFTETGRFVYAEDRLKDLNGVLAILQPVLSVAALPGTELLRDSFDHVVDELDELKTKLELLDLAEEEKHAEEELEAVPEGEGEPTEQPTDAQIHADLVRWKKARRHAAQQKAKREAGKLPQPAAPIGEPGERTSTLFDGPEVEPPPSPPTTLTGAPDEPAVERAPRPSTVLDES